MDAFHEIEVAREVLALEARGEAAVVVGRKLEPRTGFEPATC